MSRIFKTASIAALGATSMMLSITPAAIAEGSHPDSMSGPSVIEAIEGKAKTAFASWAEDTTASDVLFDINGLTSESNIEWLLAYTNEPAIVEQLVKQGQVDDPSKVPSINDFRDGVKEPTLADSNGSLVAILPFDSHEIEHDGSIRLKNVVFGITDDDTSFVTDTNNLGLIYDIGGGNTTGFDINEGVIPSVRDSDMQSLFRKDNQSAVIDMSTLANLAPDGDAVIERVINIANDAGRELTSRIKAYVSTDDDSLDAKDGRNDGMTPLLDANGQPVESVKSVTSSGDVTHQMRLSSAGDNNFIYLSHELVDENGNRVSPLSNEMFSSAKPVIDVQASTETSSSQLDANKDKQRIFNSVNIAQMQPLQPYQVLVNLYKCGGPGDCQEVAAVNREIIPDSSSRVEHFSVDIDTSSLDKEKGSYEWTTRVFKGTGDVKKMGEELASVVDHPAAQVVSFNSKQTPNGSESTNVKQHSDTVTLADGEVKESHKDIPDHDLRIENNAPSASIDEIRENNTAREVTEEKENSSRKSLITVVSIVGLGIVAIAALVGTRRVNESKNKTKPRGKHAVTKDGDKKKTKATE